MSSPEDSPYISARKITVRQGGSIDAVSSSALKDPNMFWGTQAKNLLWFKEWDRVVDWNPPFAKWFVGGRINASVNCLDRHIDTERKNKAAIIWEAENGDDSTILTYFQLYKLVNKFANVLKGLGVAKGDRVSIYLPTCPELAVAMLACARIGAVHSVVFSGFSSQALADRINDAGSKMLITADGGIRKGKLVELKKIADEAIQNSSTVQHVIVLKRSASADVKLGPKDHWWHELMDGAKAYCEPEILDSTHPLYILYTSGTTGKPKGVVHGTGGYLVHLFSTAKWVFGFRDQDIFFCTADIGWVTGHSYMVYAPLMHGVTEIMYEGAADYPKPDRYWAVSEKYGATILYTTPTALRMYMKYGDSIPNSFDLSSLRLLGTVGEPINPEVWMWYFKVIGKENCPIVDTWWQTETGGIMLSMCTDIETIPMKPGSASKAIPGVDAAVVDDDGNQVPPGKKGYLVLRKPWPGMLLTLWGDDDKYQKTYWQKFHGMYYAGDYAIKDSEGYIWMLGRADDVLKVSGHRLGTMEIESALVSHPGIAEAAATAKPDPAKGEAIIAFVVPKEGTRSNEDLKRELTNQVRNKVGPIAVPQEIHLVTKLPKTRSGKIMRRLLRSIASGQPIGDTTTLEDGAAVNEVKQAYEEMKREIS